MITVVPKVSTVVFKGFCNKEDSRRCSCAIVLQGDQEEITPIM